MLHFFKSHYIYLNCENVHFQEIPNNTKITIKTNENLPGINEAFQIESNIIIERFKHGDICFLAKENDKYLGILWGHTGDCYIRGVGKRLNLKQNEVYLYGIYTLPEARRKNVFNTLKYSFFKYYSERCVNKYYALVAPRNHIMITTLKKVGFIERSRLFYIRIAKVGLLHEYQFDSEESSLKIVTAEPRDCIAI
jgi:hypothetical protein